MQLLPRHSAQCAPAKWSPGRALRWVFDAEAGPQNRFVARWIFLRALAIFYFSAFYSLLFQIEGLIGPRGVLPAQRFLVAVNGAMGPLRFWYAPTLFWFSSGERAMMAVTWLGLIASVAAFCNLWPRLSFLVCLLCFLSFVTAAQAFSSYQSDGMLLEAGFLALFFAPRGLLPGWGIASPPSRASLFLLQWEWFRIYFESGMVKLLSGDPQWRNYTAMDEYYQNGPLPTWIGWYIEHLPHWFHAATVAGTLVMELGVVWMLFLPRRARLICFFIVTPWEIGVILTANYTFLNYLVLALGFLLLDDRSVRWLLPKRLRATLPEIRQQEQESISQGLKPDSFSALYGTAEAVPFQNGPEGSGIPDERSILKDSNVREESSIREDSGSWTGSKEDVALKVGGPLRFSKMALLCVSAVMLAWIGYATTAEMLRMQWPELPLPAAPIAALDPFRIANQYGLFAVMTRGRYEIEFQGSNDGVNWTPYRFRYKPQALIEAPRIYAPYQPRFEWNLWFASLGDWQQNDLVPETEERLLENDQDVLNLFRGNPFAQAPPRYVRAVLWQYWFTSMDEKGRTGDWWKRSLMGLYAPVVTLQTDGKFAVVQWPDELPPHD